MRLLPPRLLVPLLVAAALGAAAASAHRAARSSVTVLEGAAMGARYSVTIGSVLDARAKARAAAVVSGELARIDALMSNWRADSEVERVNRSRTTAPIAVSRELAELVAIARRVSDVSGGAFDITVAPVVQAWGFGPSARADALGPVRGRPGRGRDLGRHLLVARAGAGIDECRPGDCRAGQDARTTRRLSAAELRTQS